MIRIDVNEYEIKENTNKYRLSIIFKILDGQINTNIPLI